MQFYFAQTIDLTAQPFHSAGPLYVFPNLSKNEEKKKTSLLLHKGHLVEKFTCLWLCCKQSLQLI